MIIGQAITYADGSYSQFWHSFDGRNNLEELDPTAEFKFWIMMAQDLAGKPGLDEGRRAFVQSVSDAFWDAIKRAEGKANNARTPEDS